MKRLTFLFSIMVMLLVSGLIASPAGAATINVLGSWVTGTSHTKESGTDRALIFIAHAESTSTINLSAVSYGGQAMTKVVDYSYNAASGYAYAAAFILKESGVAAASSSTFSVTWGGTAPGSAGYSSVFLSNVNQTTATGATGTGGKTSNPVTTSALATSSGDMVILGATCGNAGSYTLNNSFIEGSDQQINGTVTGVTGRKSATGANETPSATYSSTINRQMIIGLVVKATGGTTPTLSVSPTSLTVAAAAGSTGTFNITSNVSWTVSSNQTWLTVSPTSGSNNGTVTVTATSANTGSARTATVTVSATGVTSQTVTVTQSGTGNTLSVSPTSLSVAAAAGSTGTFNITSNVSWTVSSNQTWLTASPTSGSNNGTVTVTATSANTGGARTATVTVSGTGVTSQTVTVTQSGTGGGGGDENCDFSGCTIPAMPSFSSLPTNAYLPDPFTFMNGTRMTTKAEWDCRRAEIATLIQEFESGYKPCTPYSATTATFSGSTLTVTVNDNGKQISFSCSVSKPSGTGPFPVLLTCGGSSLPSVSSLGVATVNIPNDTIAQQTNSSSRGKGKFYDMYGSGHSASAMMAWAWGASRIIDAIEKTASSSNLDPTRIAVTGCSRNGKGALMCGAFDERISLTIPQESGSGGSASWRVSEYLHVDLGQNTQELCEIVGENVWFRANFNQFCGNEGKLPTDHHELIGLCAPRAIYIIDNNIDWLGEESSWNCANAAKKIWTALGVPDKFGYSGTGSHTHCAFPSSQQTELNAYIGKYLVGGGTGTTGIMRNDAGFTYDAARWVNWSTPTLQ